MKKILIVNANYYENITTNLLKVSKQYLKRYNFSINLLNVPGVFEIPIAIRKNIKKYDAFIAIGCVIKGKTPHFELICKSAFEAMMRISVEFNKPIGNGVITSLNKKQAYERCGIIKSKNINKGLEAAKAVVSIIENGPKKI